MPTLVRSERVAAALASKCPDPTCDADEGEFCFDATHGFHTARYEAAVERIVAAEASADAQIRPGTNDLAELAAIQRRINQRGRADEFAAHQRERRHAR